MKLIAMHAELEALANASVLSSDARQAAQRGAELTRAFRSARDLPWDTDAATLHTLALQPVTPVVPCEERREVMQGNLFAGAQAKCLELQKHLGAIEGAARRAQLVLNNSSEDSTAVRKATRLLLSTVNADDIAGVVTAANYTEAAIVCPECHHEIAPDPAARADILAAVSAYSDASHQFARDEGDFATTVRARAHLLALLGIKE